MTKKLTDERRQEIDAVLKSVFETMTAMGYDAIGQIWGYLLTEDPAYITARNDARKLITSVEREDIGRYLLEKYFNV